ncbi:MAG TPA: glycosyltransferase family 39 protein [Devosia sp.]|nr:glycosyltransferase family 39 protein [Devosia sp.]
MGETSRIASPISAPTRRDLIVLLVLSTAIRLAVAGLTDLSVDECYALAISRTFQWSFFDHPPLAFWIAFTMQSLFGSELPALLLRLPFVLMFTMSSWLMFALTARFFGERAGLWAAGFFTAAPFFFISAGSWVVPDGPLALALLAAAFFLARALDGTGRAAWRDWIIAGLCLGVALLSKYQAVIVALGAMLVLAMPAYRQWLRRPHPYAAALVALVLSVPVIAWNATHGWVSIAFQFGRGGIAWALKPLQMLVLLAGEAIYLWPWIFVGLVVAAAVSRGHARFFLPLALPLILLFNLLPLLGRPGLPHWSMPGWMFFFPALGQLAAAARERQRKWPVVLGAVSALATLAVPLGIVLTLSAWRVIPGNPSFAPALAEGADWTGVREGLADAGLLDRPRTFYAAMSWMDGARITASLRPAILPVVLGPDPRGFAFVQNPNDYVGQDAIFVEAEWDLAAAKDFAARYFESYETIGTFETMKGRMPAFSHTVLLAHNFKEPIKMRYGLGLE